MSPTVSGLLTAVIAAVVGLLARTAVGRGRERSELVEARRGLSPLQRRRVRRAVVRGQAVSDPGLAAAAVAQARYGRAYSRSVSGLSRAAAVLGLLVIAGAVVLLLRARTRTLGVLPALAGAFMTTIPWQHAFYGRRRDRAEQADLAPAVTARDLPALVDQVLVDQVQ